MNAKDRDNKFKAIFECELEIMQRKSHDYAKDKNVLSNFNEVADLMNTSSYKIILTEVNKKLIRLNNLTQREECLNESVIDTISDMRNYLFLAMLSLEK